MKSKKQFGPKLEKISYTVFQRLSDKKLSQIDGFFEDTIIEDKIVLEKKQLVYATQKKILFSDQVKVCQFGINEPPEVIKRSLSASIARTEQEILSSTSLKLIQSSPSIMKRSKFHPG